MVDALHSVRDIFLQVIFNLFPLCLRMYCIDRAGVPESHDAHAFYCLYD